MDSLTYLTLDRLVEATGAVGAGFCDACLTGTYPIDIPVNLSKGVLEVGDGPAAERTVTVGGNAPEAELPTDATNRLFGQG